MFRAVDARHTKLGAAARSHAWRSGVHGNGNGRVPKRRRRVSQGAGSQRSTPPGRPRRNAGNRDRLLPGVCLLLVFALVVVRFRRRVNAARVAEVRRLAELGVTDPLTELRNHRAFHEDLPTEATWVRHHHARYDGRGYPDGLAGEASANWETVWEWLRVYESSASTARARATAPRRLKRRGPLPRRTDPANAP
jgi:hypothetical protein